jgi:hypothetical protein
MKQGNQTLVIKNEELVRRAYRAWFSGKIDWFDLDHLPKPGERTRYRPNTPTTAVVEQYDGHRYVVLQNEQATVPEFRLAVYRVKNDGMLKRLRRWPAAIEGRVQ